MWVNGQAASGASAGRRSALGLRGSSGRVGHTAHCVTTWKYWHGQKNRPNDGYGADLRRQCWARGVVWRLSRIPGSWVLRAAERRGGAGRAVVEWGRVEIGTELLYMCFTWLRKSEAGMADSESSSCVYSVVYKVNACTRRVCRCMASEAG